MEICLAKEEHLAELEEMEKICFSIPWSKNALLQTMQSGATSMYVALEKGLLCGYCAMYTVADEGYIANICVLPQHRGRGIGQKLTEKLLEIAQVLQLAFVSLEVRTQNVQAISLYKKLGFVEIGRRPNFYAQPKDDALIMNYVMEEKQ